MAADRIDNAAPAEASDAIGPLPSVFRPFVDGVARIKATVHVKLLAGFLAIALLLLGMGVFSMLVINRMNQHVDALTVLQTRTDLARQMIYGVTAQSHFRAMALITLDDSWNDKITVAKADFLEDLESLEAIGDPDEAALFDQLREIDARFAVAGNEVLALYQAGDIDGALEQHILQEHEISHELEDLLNAEIAESEGEISTAAAQFRSDRGFLTAAVATFSAVSLVGALFLGAILSWSLIRPVRKIDRALALIAGGDFLQRVDVPNRDEFGALTSNLNRTSEQLASLYEELESLNANLEKTVAQQVDELERAGRLRRYVSPQVADAILAGDAQVSLASNRRELTTFFCDIRGFTELSERMEPEELIDALNHYLTEMTEIVFQHGGTLDKYIGDELMVFFGDPIPHEDHAQRAVAMAFEMRSRVEQLRGRWSMRHEEELTVGMGLSTGYVTVGNIGSPARSEYTVIGNHVNLASRLAGQAGPAQILVSERTMLAVRDEVDGKEIDQVRLKGVHRPMRIYEINSRRA